MQQLCLRGLGYRAKVEQVWSPNTTKKKKSSAFKIPSQYCGSDDKNRHFSHLEQKHVQ